MVVESKNRLARSLSSGILIVSSFVAMVSTYVTLSPESAQACVIPKVPKKPPKIVIPEIPQIIDPWIITSADPFPTDTRLACTAGAGFSKDGFNFEADPNGFSFGIFDPDAITFTPIAGIIELVRDPSLDSALAAQPDAEVSQWYGFSGFMNPFQVTDLPGLTGNQEYAYRFSVLNPLEDFNGVSLQTAAGQSLNSTEHPVIFSAPKIVPEPTSTLSLLALGTLGAASTLKRKLKPSKSAEKETTKVS